MASFKFVLCVWKAFDLLLLTFASVELAVQELPARTVNADENLSADSEAELVLPEVGKFSVQIVDKPVSQIKSSLLVGGFKPNTADDVGIDQGTDHHEPDSFKAFVAKQRILNAIARDNLDEKSSALNNDDADIPANYKLGNGKQGNTATRMANLRQIERFLRLMKGQFHTADGEDVDDAVRETDEQDIRLSQSAGNINTEKRIFLLPLEPKQDKSSKPTAHEAKVDRPPHSLYKALWYLVSRPVLFTRRMPSVSSKHSVAKRKWYFKRYMYFDDLASSLVG